MSLIGTGEAYKQQAQATFGSLSSMEQSRNETNKKIKMADKAQQMQMAGMGAGIGAMAAMGAKTGTFAGPWGTLIGAGIGAAAGLLGNEFL